MGTLATKSQAVAKSFSTRRWSSAKNRILRIRRRTASVDDNSSMRFSGPCSRKNKAETGAVQFSPDLASSPAKGVPNAEYPLGLELVSQIGFGKGSASAAPFRVWENTGFSPRGRRLPS